MPTEVEISEGPGGAPGGVDIGDLWKYGEIIGRVLSTVKSAENLAVGGSMDLDPIKLRVRGKEFEYDPGVLKRTK